MTDAESNLSGMQAAQLLGLSETALKSGSIDQFAAAALPHIAALMRSSSTLLYVHEPHLNTPGFFQHGTWQRTASELENMCAEYFERLPASPMLEVSGNLALYPLPAEDGLKGLLGLAMEAGTSSFPPDVLEKVLQLLAAAIQQLAERARSARELAQLNAYLTVSSMLAQSQGLHEQLEVALYCCRDLVAAEEASVLLLDDEKRNLRFYHVEGPGKGALDTATFPADKGLAGSVLQSQQSEVVNHVAQDARFYGKIDADFGFPTRNIIAIPLTAGEEKVGVLEVVNKSEGKDFTEDDRLLLLSIAEEIAFAIRNAKVFEYVVNSYCKQRQGIPSCKGCQRPLGSWTPCVRYQEAML